MLKQVIEHFDLHIASFHEVDDSHSSTVYRCQLVNGVIIFLKIPFTKLKFHRELEAYNILNGRIPIPSLLGHWSGDDEIPGAFVLSTLKGQPLTPKESPSLAYQVGVIHASMHSIHPPANLQAVQNEFPGWSGFVEKQFYSFAEDVKKVLDAPLFKQSIKKFEDMKRQLPAPDGPSFVHMDFFPANILVNQHDVSGIIDFESVRFGSTEIDFTKLYRDFLSFDMKLLNAYKDGYCSIRPLINLEVVLPFYRFTDAFNSIGWCRRRGIERNKRFLRENVAILHDLLKN